MSTDFEDRMKRTWNDLAQRNAMHFIATDRDDWDLDAFLESGRADVEGFLARCEELPPRGEGVALELGCGIGRLCLAMAREFDSVIGVDVSENMIERANGLREELGVDNVRFHCGNGSDFAFVPDGTCDFALSYQVLQHMPSKDLIRRSIGELGRVVKTGGYVLFQIPVYQERLVVYPWRLVQRVFRTLLPKGESLGLVAPERGIAFRGSRLTMPVLQATLREAHLRPMKFERSAIPYRYCDQLIVCARKLVH